MKKHFFKVFMLSLGLTGATSMFAASYMDTAAINLNLRNVTIEQALGGIFSRAQLRVCIQILHDVEYVILKSITQTTFLSPRVKEWELPQILNNRLRRLRFQQVDRHLAGIDHLF